MAALAREQRPCAAHPGAVERRAVGVLSVTVMTVTLPAWPLRKIMFDHRINHRQRIDDDRIVRVA